MLKLQLSLRHIVKGISIMEQLRLIKYWDCCHLGKNG